MQNKRLLKEYKNLEASPPPFIIARPQENNLLECHYIITGISMQSKIFIHVIIGCPDSPYASGQYHGK